MKIVGQIPNTTTQILSLVEDRRPALKESHIRGIFCKYIRMSTRSLYLIHGMLELQVYAFSVSTHDRYSYAGGSYLHIVIILELE